MKLDMTAKSYNDEGAARAHLEEQLRLGGPVCPHCGSLNATELHGRAIARVSTSATIAANTA